MAEAGTGAQQRTIVSSGSVANLRQQVAGMSPGRRVAMMVGAAVVIALLVGVTLWSREPAWRILFTNVPDKDGGAIIQSLQQMNVPYKLEAGGTIQVPSEQVYDVRLRLAGQGLPKAGNVGFELMDNQKFGTSQFAEQVNYQRAIEGELARSIESISVVDQARVHLAIPKQTVFLRDQQKPSASIVVKMQRGRSLDNGQVAGIVHLVSSSVPDLPVQNVTLVDQDGNLLSRGRDNQRTKLDPEQLQYVQQLERNYVDRIEAILTPIVGRENVRAEVTAQVDFAEIEETSEKFRPNDSASNPASIRSQQSLDLKGAGPGESAIGVPGALSNQPPGTATAPLTAVQASGAATTVSGGSPSTRRESTTNYELDKTIQHVKQPTGNIKRLSAAIVVNYKLSKNKDGNLVPTPMSPQEMTQINALVREALGFNQPRGDSLNVVNAAFAGSDLEEAKPLQERAMDYFKANMTDMIKLIIIVLAVLYLLFFIIRPLMRDLSRPRDADGHTGFDALAADTQTGEETPEREEDQVRMAAFADLLQQAKEEAKKDPRMVATVLREWMLAGEDSSDSNKKN